jgi:hypothetical protein
VAAARQAQIAPVNAVFPRDLPVLSATVVPAREPNSNTCNKAVSLGVACTFIEGWLPRVATPLLEQKRESGLSAADEELSKEALSQENMPEEYSFDELAKEMAQGTISRGRALKLFGTAIVGGLG